MKSRLVAVLVAVLMSWGGLQTLPGAVAEASCDRYGPCPGQPRVELQRDKKVEAGQRSRVKLKVDYPGDATVTGTFTLIVRRVGEGVVWKRAKPLNQHGAATHRTSRFTAGRYRVIAKFIPTEGSPWSRATRIYTLEVD